MSAATPPDALGHRSVLAGLMAVIAMMVIPVPPVLVDLGLTISFALAILVFALTLFVERPLDFSSIPTILLGSLMLRLALNISSTRLIIGEGHTGPDAAGHVIMGFSNFVMGGNIFLGLVVFCVIMIVNFMVITKGAGRMAEVGARFALDAMPGKQLAIDSDVAAGAISHEEARERRQREQEETTFFGSLDGASKIVKGDAVAGLLITLLNLVIRNRHGCGGTRPVDWRCSRNLVNLDSWRQAGVANSRRRQVCCGCITLVKRRRGRLRRQGSEQANRGAPDGDHHCGGLHGVFGACPGASVRTHRGASSATPFGQWPEWCRRMGFPACVGGELSQR